MGYGIKTVIGDNNQLKENAIVKIDEADSNSVPMKMYTSSPIFHH